MRIPKPTWRKPTWRELAAGLVIILLIFVVLWWRCGLRGCPNIDQLSAYQPGGQSILYDARGNRLGELAPIQHDVVKLSSLPEYVPAAFVAVEDKRFYQHHGVDYRRFMGSVAANIKSLGFAQGFSTITMQISGSVWRDRVPRMKKTVGRKILEVRLARAMEKKYSKDEILELYLNNIYYGNGAYGIEAAARNYFGRSAKNLTVAQAATLAALPKSPTIYDPRRNPDRARRRRNLVLGLMAEQGKISADQAERAKAASIGARRDPPARERESPVAPYFVEAVRRVLEDHFGENLYTAPLRVYTTLDRSAQRAAEEELSKQLRAIENGTFGRYKGKRYTTKSEPLEETEYVQGAMVVLNARNGGVMAHVGGRDFRQSTFDRVTRARRQAGSAFKPFVYAAALSEGYTASQPIKDEPLKMELEGGEVWEPKNVTGDFRGQMTMRQALVQSRNIPTIRLAAEVGVNDVARVARQSGIRSAIPESPAMAIGTAAVTPLEMARSYTPFATLGTSVQPRWIDRVEDAEGNVVWKPEVRRNQVLDEGVAYLVTNMLQDAVDYGTGTAVRSAGFHGAAAGKTGTTNDAADVWFVGYTPNIVSAVWVGFDDPQEIVSDASGGRIAAPVWGRVMRRIYASRAQPRAWQAPESIVRRTVDPGTGFVIAEGCKPQRGAARKEMFLSYAQPATTCPRGKPEHEPTFFNRAFAWMRSAWHDVTEWIAEHVGRERDRDRGRDRYLGVPKLPQQEEVPAPVIDSAMIIELDTMPIEPDTFMVDTFPVDTFMVDTLTLPPDTVPPDTLRPDTISRGVAATSRFILNITRR
ncbi:MAG TPA: PBP1A family penicillin-binding protein [Longimicrobiales bacterium]